MPSPITEVLRIIAEDWVATAPPDHAERPYAYASDEAVDPEDDLAHRSFWFELERGEPVSETDDMALVPYTIRAILVLDSDGYTPGEFTEAIANEPAALMRLVETRSDWTDGNTVEGIWFVETVDVTPEPVSEDSTAMLIVMSLNARVGES